MAMPNQFLTGLSSLTAALRDFKDRGFHPSEDYMCRLIDALSDLEDGAYDIANKLDAYHVESRGSLDDPYELYSRLSDAVDMLTAIEDGEKKLNISHLKNDIFRCAGMSATIGHRLRRYEEKTKAQVEAAIAREPDKVVLFSEVAS